MFHIVQVTLVQKNRKSTDSLSSWSSFVDVWD